MFKKMLVSRTVLTSQQHSMDWGTTIQYIIFVSPTVHELETVARISDFSHIAIIGLDGGAVVNCYPSAGFEISSSTDLKIESITFNGCSYEHEVNLVMVDDYYQHCSYHYSIPASLYLHSCDEVLLFNVSIMNSSGAGMLLNEVSGNVTIDHCQVNNCSRNFIGNVITNNCVLDP